MNKKTQYGIMQKVLDSDGMWWINSESIANKNYPYEDFKHRNLTDETEVREALQEAINLTAKEYEKETAQKVRELKNNLFKISDWHNNHGDGQVLVRGEVIKEINKLFPEVRYGN